MHAEMFKPSLTKLFYVNILLVPLVTHALVISSSPSLGAGESPLLPRRADNLGPNPLEAKIPSSQRLACSPTPPSNFSVPTDPYVMDLFSGNTSHVQFYGYVDHSYTQGLLEELVSQSLDAFSATRMVRRKTRDDVFTGSWQLDINEGMEISFWAQGGPPIPVPEPALERVTYGLIEDAIATLPTWGALWGCAGLKPRKTYWAIDVQGKTTLRGSVDYKRYRPPISHRRSLEPALAPELDRLMGPLGK